MLQQCVVNAAPVGSVGVSTLPVNPAFQGQGNLEGRRPSGSALNRSVNAGGGVVGYAVV